MENLKLKFNYLTAIYFFISVNVIFSQTLENAVNVPVFEGTVVENTVKDIYWDLSEINNSNNRLDLAAGVTQEGFQAPNVYNYTNGNWYKNQNNSNFNGEDINLRFIYQNESVNGINGLFFARLNTGYSKKDVVLTRNDSILYIYQNSGSSISQSPNFQFKVYGKIAAVGNFTNDTLEDVAVISGSNINIYKNLGNSTLDTVPVYTLYNVYANKVIFAQVSNLIYPYSEINNSTNDRDEIIFQSGSNIRIFKNNNNNGFSDSTTICINNSPYTDFKISDIDNDGYNELLVAANSLGMKIYKNNSGIIDTIAIYSNINYSLPTTIDVADFNKDGFNDIIMSNLLNFYLFLNSNGNFSQTASYSKSLNGEYIGRKIKAVDLHNKGGISVLFSSVSAITDSIGEPELINSVEYLTRFNASDTDAVPAPAYLFEDFVQQDTIYHPKLLLFNRGDRDFQKYRIYKMNWVTYHYYLFDSTSADSYIDTTERFLYSNYDPSDPPPDNLFYYVVAVDNSYKVSVTSDTIGYPSYVCPECGGEIGPRGVLAGNEFSSAPLNYSITNYPNPFNPSTKIFYTLPLEGIVKITVYNSLGQKLKEIVNEFKNAGSYSAEFNGSGFASGIYYYRLESGSFSQTKKMLLIK